MQRNEKTNNSYESIIKNEANESVAELNEFPREPGNPRDFISCFDIESLSPLDLNKEFMDARDFNRHKYESMEVPRCLEKSPSPKIESNAQGNNVDPFLELFSSKSKEMFCKNKADLDLYSAQEPAKPKRESPKKDKATIPLGFVQNSTGPSKTGSFFCKKNDSLPKETANELENFLSPRIKSGTENLNGNETNTDSKGKYEFLKDDWIQTPISHETDNIFTMDFNLSSKVPSQEDLKFINVKKIINPGENWIPKSQGFQRRKRKPKEKKTNDFNIFGESQNGKDFDKLIDHFLEPAVEEGLQPMIENMPTEDKKTDNLDALITTIGTDTFHSKPALEPRTGQNPKIGEAEKHSFMNQEHLFQSTRHRNVFVPPESPVIRFQPIMHSPNNFDNFRVAPQMALSKSPFSSCFEPKPGVNTFFGNQVYKTESKRSYFAASPTLVNLEYGDTIHHGIDDRDIPEDVACSDAIDRDVAYGDIVPLSNNFILRIKLYNIHGLDEDQKFRIMQLKNENPDIRLCFLRTMSRMADILGLKKLNFKRSNDLRVLYNLLRNHGGILKAHFETLNSFKSTLSGNLYYYLAYVLPLESSGMFQFSSVEFQQNRKGSSEHGDSCGTQETRCRQNFQDIFDIHKKNIKISKIKTFYSKKKFVENESSTIISKKDVSSCLSLGIWDDILFLLEELEKGPVANETQTEILELFFHVSDTLSRKSRITFHNIGKFRAKFVTKVYRHVIERMSFSFLLRIQCLTFRIIIRYEKTKRTHLALNKDLMLIMIDIFFKRRCMFSGFPSDNVDGLSEFNRNMHLHNERPGFKPGIVNFPPTSLVGTNVNCFANEDDMILDFILSANVYFELPDFLMPIIERTVVNSPDLILRLSRLIIASEKRIKFLFLILRGYIESKMHKHIKTLESRMLLNDNRELESIITVFLPFIIPTSNHNSYLFLTQITGIVNSYQNHLNINKVYFFKKNSSRISTIQEFLKATMKRMFNI